MFLTSKFMPLTTKIMPLKGIFTQCTAGPVSYHDDIKHIMPHIISV